jgi:hypothetical protein
MQKPVAPLPIQISNQLRRLLALQCLLAAAPTSQEKKIFYAGEVAHVISEAKARCTPCCNCRRRYGGASRGRSSEMFTSGLDKQKPQTMMMARQIQRRIVRSAGHILRVERKELCGSAQPPPQISRAKKKPLVLAALLWHFR